MERLQPPPFIYINGDCRRKRLDEPQHLCLPPKLRPVIRMGNGNQCIGTLTDGFALELCNSKFRDDIVNIIPRCGDYGTGGQCGFDFAVSLSAAGRKCKNTSAAFASIGTIGKAEGTAGALRKLE